MSFTYPSITKLLLPYYNLLSQNNDCVNVPLKTTEIFEVMKSYCPIFFSLFRSLFSFDWFNRYVRVIGIIDHTCYSKIPFPSSKSGRYSKKKGTTCKELVRHGEISLLKNNELPGDGNDVTSGYCFSCLIYNIYYLYIEKDIYLC